IGNEDLQRIREVKLEGFKAITMPIFYRPDLRKPGLAEAELPDHADKPRAFRTPATEVTHVTGEGLDAALGALFDSADRAIREGHNLIILSDRGVNERKAPIPALLAVAGLHHHLFRQGTRTKVSIILESGEPREVM